MHNTEEKKNEKYFKNDAKHIVDAFFDAKLFKDEITRDDMNAFENFIAEVMQLKFDSHMKIEELMGRFEKLDTKD